MKFKSIKEIIGSANIEKYAYTRFKKVKKTGISHISCLCPFHDDNRPSFSIHKVHGGWKCFSCNKSGNFISLVINMENLTFPEAIHFIKEQL